MQNRCQLHHVDSLRFGQDLSFAPCARFRSRILKRCFVVRASSVAYLGGRSAPDATDLRAPFSEVTTKTKKDSSAEKEDKSAGGRDAFPEIQFSFSGATDPKYGTKGTRKHPGMILALISRDSDVAISEATCTSF